MFGFIKGLIAYKNKNVVIIDCNGVGYEMQISTICYNKIGVIGDEVQLWTHLAVKQDEISLVGFESLQEREVFRKLISVNGVGTKMALAILGEISAQDLVVAIATGKSEFLKGIKGVGTKIRERIILELKEKMGQVDDVNISITNSGNKDLFNSAVSILMDWGVQKGNAEKIISDNISNEDNLETLIAKAFRDMGR